MTEPSTDNGRALLDAMILPVDHEPPYSVTEAVRLEYREQLAVSIVAIEAEASLPEVFRAVRVRGLVGRLPRHSCEPCDPDPDGWAIDRAAVLALLDSV